MKLITLCLLLAVGCGASETVGDALDFNDVHTASELRSKMGEPCSTNASPDGSETWMYCVLIGAGGREFQAACRPDCPQRYEFVVRFGIVTNYKTVGLP